MKNLKKLGAILCAVSMLTMLLCVPTQAKIIHQEEFQSYPSDWEFTQTNGVAEVKEGKLSLAVDTQEAVSGEVVALSPLENIENARFFISADVSFSSSDSGTNQRLRIVDAQENELEILRIVGQSTVYAFGARINAEAGSELEETLNGVCNGEMKKLVFLVDMEATTGTAWIDGVELYNGSFSIRQFDASRVQAKFLNKTPARACQSEIQIESFGMYDETVELTSQPADGEGLLNGAEIQTVTLDFGTLLNPSSVMKENMTFESDGASVDFNVTVADTGIILSPITPLENGKTYTVSVNGCYGYSGAALEGTITFSTAQDGYEYPEVEITAPQDGAEYYVGETADVMIHAQANNGLDRVELYVDGSLAQTFQGEETIEYSVKISSEGQLQLKAIAYDVLGGSASSAPITLTCYDNEAPQVEIIGITDGETYERAQLSEVGVSAQDVDGTVEKIELFVNGRLFQTVEGDQAVVDLSGLSAGYADIEAIAYDNYGMTTSVMMQIVVSGNRTENILIDTDFDTKQPGSNLEFPSQNGYIDQSFVVDEEHGNSVAVGCREVVTSRLPYLRFVTGSSGNYYVLEAEIYLHSSSLRAGFEFVGAETPRPSWIVFQNGELSVTRSADTAKIPYETGKWYRLRFALDLSRQTMSVYFGENELTTIMENESFRTSLTNLTEVRLFATTVDADPDSYYVMDNIRFSTVEYEPYITGVGYDSTFEPVSVPKKLQTLNVLLSAGLLETSVNSQTVTLYDSDGQRVEAAVSYDAANQAIKIEPNQYLKPNASYRVVVGTGAQTPSGAALSSEISYTFTTAQDLLRVTDVQFRSAGDTVQCVAELANAENASNTVYVIMNVWQGDALIQTVAAKETVLSDSMESISLPAITMQPGQKAQVLVVNDLTWPQSISEPVYEYTK